MKVPKSVKAPRKTRAEALLARMSLGAVPLDGVYWIDPRELRKAQIGANDERSSNRDRQCNERAS
ncbi:MAG TPA: hypothetical protein VF221_07385, partial [Chloroflexota bacterium]